MSRRTSDVPNAATRRSTSVSRPSASASCPVSTSERWQQSERIAEIDIDGADAPSSRSASRAARSSTARYGSRAAPARARSSRRSPPVTDSSSVQRFDLARVERRAPSPRASGTPAGHVGVIVGLPSRSPPIHDPKRSAPRRAATRGRWLAQRAIERAQVSRQRVPQRLLEDEQAAADLFHRRRPPWPHLLGPPHGEDLAAQVLDDLLALAARSDRHGPAARAPRAIRICLAASVRRVIAVGCAVSTSSIRSDATAS